MRLYDVATGKQGTMNYWDGEKWVPIRASGGGSDDLVVDPPTGPERNIATGAGMMNIDASVGSGMLVKARMRILVDAEHPIAEFDLSFTGAIALPAPGGEGKSSTVQLAIATSTQPLPRSVTFNGGHRAVTVTNPAPTSAPAPGNDVSQTVRTDPLPYNLRAGDDLIVYGWAGGDGLAVTDSQGYLADFDDGFAAGVFTHAVTAPLAQEPMTDAPTRRGARPARVIAPSDQPAWIISGDSIVHNSYSHLDRFARHYGLAYAKHARSGATTASETIAYEHRFRGNGYATHLIDQLGVNGWTADKQLELWRRHLASGIEWIVKTTITPRASSSDGWTSLAGQTPISQATVNDWLLDGAPVTSDWADPLPAGTTDPDAVRCRVVNVAGDVLPGAGSHPCTGGVVDMAGAVAEPTDRDRYRVDLGLVASDYGDGLHYGEGIHRLCGERLIRDVPKLLPVGQ